MSALFLETAHVVNSLAPVADAFAGTVTSDVQDMKDYSEAVFIAYKGVGATGTSTLTVEACDDIVPTNVSAIPFWYKQTTSGDTEGTMTKAAAAGFTTTAGSAGYVIISVPVMLLGPSGYRYIRLKAVEVANDPVLGGILFAGVKAKRPGASQNSVID